MHKLAVISALFVLGGVVLAAAGDSPTTQPQSPAARQALAQYHTAEARAVAVYQHTEKGLLRDLAAGLDRARRIALYNGDLDEVNRIHTSLDALKDGGPVTVAPLARDIIGSTWQLERWNRAITYKADGTCTSDDHYNGRWQVVGENTIGQVQHNGDRIMITFTADRKAAVWQITDRDGAHVVTGAVRVATDAASGR